MKVHQLMAKAKKKKKDKGSDDMYFGDIFNQNTPPKAATTTTATYKQCKHTGEEPVKVGKYEVYLAANRDITPAALTAVDVICPLNGDMPNINYPQMIGVVSYQLQDMAGVPASWETYVDYIITLLGEGKKILAWCTGSHGRTGTFLASLIAKLEPDVDPIDTARERHCTKAVETLAQLKAVYALKGQEVPEAKKPSKSLFHSAGGYSGGYHQSAGNPSWGYHSHKGSSVPQPSLSVNQVIEDFLKHNNLKGKVFLNG